MRRHVFLILLGVVLLAAVSCNPSVKPEKLYGTWKYVEVENLNRNPPYSMPAEEVKEQHPSISFSTDKSLVIMWGGKRLSHGKFRMDGSMIRYKENLAAGATREFPFLIKEISEHKLIFETMNHDPTRITAVR